METVYGVALSNLKKGCKSQDVYILQVLLNAFGYFCGTADGIWGSKTSAGVLAFRKAVGLSAVAEVNMQTWDKIFNYRK